MPHHHRRTRRPVFALVAAIIAASLLLAYTQGVSVSGREGAPQAPLTPSRNLHEDLQGRSQPLVPVNGERMGQGTQFYFRVALCS